MDMSQRDLNKTDIERRSYSGIFRYSISNINYAFYIPNSMEQNYGSKNVGHTN
jgi:hypothetical protein